MQHSRQQVPLLFLAWVAWLRITGRGICAACTGYGARGTVHGQSIHGESALSERSISSLYESHTYQSLLKCRMRVSCIALFHLS